MIAISHERRRQPIAPTRYTHAGCRVLHRLRIFPTQLCCRTWRDMRCELTNGMKLPNYRRILRGAQRKDMIEHAQRIKELMLTAQPLPDEILLNALGSGCSISYTSRPWESETLVLGARMWKNPVPLLRQNSAHLERFRLSDGYHNPMPCSGRRLCLSLPDNFISEWRRHELRGFQDFVEQLQMREKSSSLMPFTFATRPSASGKAWNPCLLFKNSSPTVRL